MDRHRFLAFDLGAESGRGVAGTLQGDQLALEEIHRFPNEPVEVCGTLFWDVLALYNQLLKGLRQYVARYGEAVDGVGVDTWGVDFGLLGRDGKLLQNPVHYRDARTQGMMEEACRRIPAATLFSCTGVPLSPVNTSLQLLALRTRQSALLDSAATLLMMPDLFHYFLTGQAKTERTNASSTQLYNPRQRGWCEDVLRKLDLPLSIMPELVDPGTVVGELREPVGRAVGLKRGVAIAPCTHDTASAVAAVPLTGEDSAFLSSGTWSVVGALTNQAVTSPEAFSAGLCNELTLHSSFLCRNIMGLWLLQGVRAAWRQKGEEYSYEELVKLAEEAPECTALLDPDDPTFYAPADMTVAIREFCARTGQPSPEKPAEMTRCILASLGVCYKYRLDQMARILGRRFRNLHVVGGGSRNPLLCQFAANATGLAVLAGPAEATVIGNLLVQAVAVGALASDREIRQVVRSSFPLVEYQPQECERWQDQYGKYLRLVEQGRP